MPESPTPKPETAVTLDYRTPEKDADGRSAVAEILKWVGTTLLLAAIVGGAVTLVMSVYMVLRHLF